MEDSNLIQLNIHMFKIPLIKIHKNFKRIQQIIVKLKHTQSKLLKHSHPLTLDTLNKLITSQDQLNKKLKTRLTIHDDLIARLKARIEFTPSSKPNYQTMDKNLLIIDYLLRSGGDPEICQIIINDLKLTQLIDYDVLSQGLSIYNEIKQNKNLNLLINWCIENEKFMPPPSTFTTNDDLETDDYFIGKYGLMFECQIQHCIELIKSNNLQLAFDIIKLQFDQYPKIPNILEKISSLSWILQFDLFKNNENLISSNNNDTQISNDPFDIYTDTSIQLDKNLLDLLNPINKWNKLADIFWFNFKSIYGLPINPPLLTMLSIGGSSLKCLKCNSLSIDSSKNDLNIFFDFKCPICSNSNWNKLFKNIPANYHSKSSIFPNPVLLPNKHILSLDLLLSASSNLNDLNNLNICSSSTMSKGSPTMNKSNSRKNLDLYDLLSNDVEDKHDNHDKIENDQGIFIYTSNRGFLNPSLIGITIDMAKNLIPDWSIEDPISFNRFKIKDLEKVYIT